MNQAEPPIAEFPFYQVGVFALVRRGETVLLVRPHRPLLPGGPQSLPGALLDSGSGGLGTVETALRRTLLSQVGIAVSDLRLVSSHVVRAGSREQPTLRLNMIFGTDYCSGMVSPDPDHFKSALWIAHSQLQENVPAWLRVALQELEPLAPADAAAGSAGGGLFGRRRAP